MDNGERGLAGLLDEAALWAKLPTFEAELPTFTPELSSFVRFLPGSTFARDFGLPPGCVGEVRDRWARARHEVLGVMVEEVGYLSSVPADEVEAA